MKLKILSWGLLAAGLCLCAPTFAGSTTNTVNVSASVSGKCRFNTSGPTALTIANSGSAIDPSLATDATGSASVLYRCTKGTAASVAADNGLNFANSSRQVKDTAGDVMAYALTLTGGTQSGTGFGASGDLTLSLAGTIVQANFVNSPAGAYSDTVTLTITP